MCRFSKTTWILILAVGVALWREYVKKGTFYNSKTDLKGKTVMITGANVGIGYETALALAKRNARVVLACRNEQKAKNAVINIRKASGTMSVDYLIVDFAEMSDIKRATEEFMQKEDRLDILINNAAVVTGGKTKDGFDNMFGINHVGYFMFTNLLMPLMRKTSQKNPVRIINVSSEAYMVGTIDLDNLSPDITVQGAATDFIRQYSNTKLMNVYFTSELHARLQKEFEGQEQPITTYCLHPGAISTNLGKELVDKRGLFYQFLRDSFLVIIAKPTAYGAQTSLYCALEEGIEQYSGGYFVDMAPAQLAENALNPTVGKNLWTVSEQLTSVKWEN